MQDNGAAFDIVMAEQTNHKCQESSPCKSNTHPAFVFLLVPFNPPASEVGAEKTKVCFPLAGLPDLLPLIDTHKICKWKRRQTCHKTFMIKQC